MIHENALIAFTMLIHLAVGSAIFYALLSFSRNRSTSALPAGIHAKTPELILVIIVLAATITSLLHLGKPAHAPNALNNLSTSWISREILGVSLFSLSLVLLFLGRWLLKYNRSILNVLFFLVIVSGVFLIAAMTRLYMIPTVITWRSGFTPVAFALQTLTLGLCGLLIYALVIGKNLSHVKPIIIWLVVALLFEMIAAGLFQRMLQQISFPHINQLISDNIILQLSVVRIIILASAVVFLLYIRGRLNKQAGKSLLVMLLVLTLLLIFFAQGLGKYIFYASFLKPGL